LGIFDSVNSPSDLRELPDEKLNALCTELRDFLIKSVSETGGHLASNLGVVELTVAVHKVFDTSKDRLVFDVGHQSYIHKMLTGRKAEFGNLRKFGGLTGFPKPTESIHDAFIAGHASTSVSAALGIARARTLSQGDYSVIALIGDGALTGGLAYEGLSDAGESGEPMVIILNDNGMAINGNVGGIARYLSRQRMRPFYANFKKRYRLLMEKLPGGKAIYEFTHRVKTAVKETLFHCSMFEEMGLQYIGPIDGHNIGWLVEALKWAKCSSTPVVVHVMTQKGRGYQYAERSPEEYHGVAPFDYRIGVDNGGVKTFSSVFGAELEELAASDSRICAITASMADGTGLSGFAERFPKRFFDVGIAEGHASTMAAGMASRGAIPVFAVYSTFLQRSYDMIVHDAAIDGMHVVFAVDRAGFVCGDGETHHGLFDVAFLSSIPGMTVLCPSSFAELRDMLRHAILEIKGPVAVRYPRGGEGAYDGGGIDSSKCMREGRDITLVTYGVNINTAIEAAETLACEGIAVEVIKLGRISPIDIGAIATSARKTGRLLVLEECAGRGSVGESIASKLAGEIKSAVLLNTGDIFAPCGETDDLRKFCGIDAESVCGAIRKNLSL
jgi:1-deoxy-D-xylulose-5-phosphate synthase